MGDLNCNFLADNSDHSTSQLRSSCEVYQLPQLINSPTRITESTSTLIDLIRTNMPSRIVSSGVIHTGISDHSLVYAVRKFSIPRKKSKYITTRQFKKFKVDELRKELKKAPWDTILNNHQDNPEVMWNKWKEIFLTIADNNTPLKTRRVRNKVSLWLTPQIRKHNRKRWKKTSNKIWCCRT